MGFNQDCNCNKYLVNVDQPCSKKKEDKSEKCCCVNQMADALKKFRGQWITVFENNYIVIGQVKEVKDHGVLVLDDVWKFRLVPVFPFFLFPLRFDKLFISICEIQEFAVSDYAQATAMVENFNQQANRQA